MHLRETTVEGKHTGVTSKMARFDLNGDAGQWYNLKLNEEHAELRLATLRRQAPNMATSVPWSYILTPLDFANKYADMVRCSIKREACLPPQMGYFGFE